MTKSNSTHTVYISGMTCVNCAKGIEKHLKKIGVEKVQVDFANASAQFIPNKYHTANDVVKEINKIGFKAGSQLIETDYSLQTFFSICLTLTIPLFCHMFLNDNHILRNPIVQLVLCLPVFLIGCYRPIVCF